MNALPKDEIKAQLPDVKMIKDLTKEGGILLLLGIPLALLAIAILFGLIWMTKKVPFVNKQFIAMKDKMVMNGIIRILYLQYVPLSITAGFGLLWADEDKKIEKNSNP